MASQHVLAKAYSETTLVQLYTCVVHASRHLTKSAWELVNGPNSYRGTHLFHSVRACGGPASVLYPKPDILQHTVV